VRDDSELIWLSATETADLIARGDLSATEAVEARIARIQQVNPRLNAVVVPLFAQALSEARAADTARSRSGGLGPLHGVPITIKEMFDLIGTPTTAGVSANRAVNASSDAVCVKRLRQAGAIVLGKTNVPQLGIMYETDNPVYGRSNNPWNLERAPGGSSGGEAAIIAAGGSPLGLGSDAAGSIREPSHACGIHGLKPTSGRLSVTGHWMFPGFPRAWVQPGPMARSVADLALAFQVMACPVENETDGNADPSVGPVVVRDPASVQIAGLRIGVYETDSHLPATPAVRRVVREAAHALRATGAQVEEFSPPDVEDAWRLYMGLSYADGMIFLQRLLKGSRRDWRIGRLFAFAEIPTAFRPGLDWLLRACRQNYLANAFDSVSRQSLSAARYFELLDAEQAYRDRFKAAIDAQQLDAIVCPASPLPATTHGNEYATFQGLASALYNVLGMPAGVVAASRIRAGEECDRPPSSDVVLRAARLVEQGSTGLPVGVQVVARHWREDVALAIMAELERYFATRPEYPLRPPI